MADQGSYGNYPPPSAEELPVSAAPEQQQYYPPPPDASQAHTAPGREGPGQGGLQDPAVPPPPPPRPDHSAFASASQAEQKWPVYNPQDYADASTQAQYLQPPPKRSHRYSGEHQIDSPIHYSRDPKKLVAYLLPFPKPRLPGIPPEGIPQRFLIYTPPPPPFIDKPADGDKEGKVHKVQRKWQEEIREAKTSQAKVTSWAGVKGRAIKGINWGMSKTKSSSLEFLNRITPDHHADDGHEEGEETKATVKLEEMVLIYPSSISTPPEKMREEFINTMLRSKTKAQRDAVIATGLLPVSAAIDILLTVVYTKLSPSETEVLEAIGWVPSSKGGAERNWEDEQWEISEVKDDLKSVAGKAAKEWVKWVELYSKSPEKALKK